MRFSGLKILREGLTGNKAWTKHWRDPEQKKEVKRLVEKLKPMLLIGSPLCTSRLQLQASKTSRLGIDWCDKRYQEVNAHDDFCQELYRLHVGSGRSFLHKHPATASLWEESAILQILNMPGVDAIIGHTPCYISRKDGAMVQKLTRWISNLRHVLNQRQKLPEEDADKRAVVRWHHDCMEWSPPKPVRDPDDMWASWNLNKVPASGNVVVEAPWWEKYGMPLPPPHELLGDIATYDRDKEVWRLHSAG